MWCKLVRWFTGNDERLCQIQRQMTCLLRASSLILDQLDCLSAAITEPLSEQLNRDIKQMRSDLKKPTEELKHSILNNTF